MEANKIAHRSVIKIALYPEKEDETPEQSERQTGSAQGYAKAVRKMLRKNKRWGWCVVRCEASIIIDGTKYTHDTYLGNCSYESELDFILNSGYYQQMAKEAISDLLKGLEEHPSMAKFLTRTRATA